VGGEDLFKRGKWLLCLAFLLALCGCGSGTTTYTITLAGAAAEPGVVSFLGYSINVYQDQASNPCGDCQDQPVHLYVGDSAEDAAAAVAEVIDRADDLWEVQSAAGGTVVLQLRDSSGQADLGTLSTVSGLDLTASYESDGVTTKMQAQQSASQAVTPEDPQRIAAIYGPSYEMLVALGVEDKIVVRADVHTDSFPWAEQVFSRISELPALENVHTAVNFEELMTYSPDIVFTFPRQNELNQLAAAGVAAVPGDSYRTLSDTCDLLTTYAQALGQDAIARAQAYRDYFSERLAYVSEKLSGLSQEDLPTVYYAGMSILTTYGKYSDLMEVTAAAGGIPVSQDLEAGSRTEINLEQLMAWDPDFIFLDHGGINDGTTVEEMQAELYAAENYSVLTAVTQQQVYTVPSGVFYWDMGLQKILLVEYMAQILHPDLFQDLDMVQELMNFYQEFYGYSLTAPEAQAILSRQLP
jgi:iron complex transport system substrate-binding protein